VSDASHTERLHHEADRCKLHIGSDLTVPDHEALEGSREQPPD
jgi:hypothetical protein